MLASRPRPALAALLVLFLGSCSFGGKSYSVPDRYLAEEVPAAIEEARLERSRPEGLEAAVERLAVAAETPGLGSSLRSELQREFEGTVQARIDQLEATGEDAKALRDLGELEVARRVAVRAGVAAARIWRDEGERLKCFRQLRSLDERFPLHSKRQEAGALLADVGLSLARDKGRYALFFRYRALAPQVLEYLVTEYPSDPNGPEALVTLASLYENAGELELAVQRHEDLLLYFPDDDGVAASQWAIPRLRLKQLKSPEYDREGLERARLEIEQWLAEFPQHHQRPEVDLLLADCLGRLADNDMVVSRFYRRVDNPQGMEYYARRALETAREAGNAEQAQEAAALIEAAIAEGSGGAQ